MHGPFENASVRIKQTDGFATTYHPTLRHCREVWVASTIAPSNVDLTCILLMPGGSNRPNIGPFSFTLGSKEGIVYINFRVESQGYTKSLSLRVSSGPSFHGGQPTKQTLRWWVPQLAMNFLTSLQFPVHTYKLWKPWAFLGVL